MAEPGDVLVANTIGDKNSAGFPTARDSEIKGGWRVVADIAARDAITTQRRVEGMLAWVLDEGQGYQLRGGITNSDWSVAGGAGFVVDVTEEAFTIAMDSVGGSDPTTPIRIRTQAESDAWGAFETVPAVIEALPNRIRHDVVLVFPDGEFALDADGLGDMGRFIFEDGAHISFQAENPLVRETATSTYAVAAGSTKRQIVLQADPGFSANEHRSKYLRVVSGTGAGQYKPIRSHSGVNWPVAGRFSPVPDATSVVEIVLRSAYMSTADNITIETQLIKGFNRNVRFDGLDLYCSGSFKTLEIRGAFVIIENGARILRMAVKVYGGGFSLGTCVIDVDGNNIGILAQSAMIRSTSTSEAWLLRGALVTAIHLISGAATTMGFPGTAYLWEGAVDDTASMIPPDGDAIKINGVGSSLKFPAGGTIQGSGNDGYGIKIIDGGSSTGIDVSAAISESETITGMLGDLGIDGTAQSWSDLDAASDKVLTSGRSWIRGE